MMTREEAREILASRSQNVLRRLMDSNRELARNIEAMELKYDEQFTVVFDAIKQLIAEDGACRSPSLELASELRR